jgi:hypothetical protein
MYSENGYEGNIFALIVNNVVREKEFLAISNVKIGCAYYVLKPKIIGEWAGIRVIQTCEPLLLTTMVQSPFLPSPFPTSVSHYTQNLYCETFEENCVD